MVRIVHTGDLHFDSPFAGLPASVALHRKEEQRKTFARIIKNVKEISADMLLIAGDLFDSRFVSASTISFLREAFSEISDIPVLISPGNHDYLSPDSLYCTAGFGVNVHVFNDVISSVQFDECTVYGYGFGERFVKESPLTVSPLHNRDEIGILLMHGDVLPESDYNPIRQEAIEASGVHYAALGHVHSHTGFLYAGRTVYAYSGIPECRHFDEPGKGGFISGEISKDGVNLSFVPSSIRENITLSVDVSGLLTIEAVCNRIKELLDKSNLFKIVLTGEKDSHLFLDTNLIEEVLGEFCMYIRVQDKTGIQYERGPESLLEKMFRERLMNKDDEISKRALMEGLAAFGRQRQ